MGRFDELKKHGIGREREVGAHDVDDDLGR